MNLDFALEVKSVDEAGSFTGFASTYGNLDHARDIVMQGAFTKTLARRGSELPVLWAHDMANPVGLGVLNDSAAGLFIRGELDLDVQAGREAHSRLKKRIVRGLSIGFQVPEGGAEMKDGIRRLKEIDLLEVSLCPVPCNDQARVTSVKSSVTTLRDFESFLHSSGWSRNESKRLSAGGWAGLSGDDGGDEEDDGELIAWLRSKNARGQR